MQQRRREREGLFMHTAPPPSSFLLLLFPPPSSSSPFSAPMLLPLGQLPRIHIRIAEKCAHHSAVLRRCGPASPRPPSGQTRLCSPLLARARTCSDSPNASPQVPRQPSLPWQDRRQDDPSRGLPSSSPPAHDSMRERRLVHETTIVPAHTVCAKDAPNARPGVPDRLTVSSRSFWWRT